MKFSREIDIERADVDLVTGEIGSLPVFTGGEASDGHVLNINGAKLPRDLPWFVQHEADPRTQLGRLLNPRVDGNALVFDGEILNEGTGAEAEVRRDLLLKIAKGHVKRLSGRWDAEQKDTIRRLDLPKNHPAFVDEKKATSAQKYGLYFEKWTPMEGSLVGLGADPAAVMRWARDEESTDSVRAFWRSLAPDDESESEVVIALELEERSDGEAGTDEPSAPDPMEEFFARFDSLEERLAALESPASEDHGRVEEPEPSPAPERVEAEPLTAPSAKADLSFDVADLLSPVNVDRLGAVMAKSLDEFEGRIGSYVQELLDLRTGKVK